MVLGWRTVFGLRANLVLPDSHLNICSKFVLLATFVGIFELVAIIL